MGWMQTLRALLTASVPALALALGAGAAQAQPE